MKVICTVWKLVIMTLWSVSITTSSLGWQQWMQAVFRRLNLSEQVTHCRVKQLLYFKDMISKAITIGSFEKPITSLGKSNIKEWSPSRKGMSNTI